MTDLIRETPFGQLVRYATRNKVFLYPEEKPGFQIPKCYNASSPVEEGEVRAEKEAQEKEVEAQVQTPESQESEDVLDRAVTNADLERATTRAELGKVTTRADLEKAYTLATLEKGPTRPIVADKLDDGTILVTWYDTLDPDNPQNWSSKKKNFVTVLIWYVKLIL